MPKRITEWHKAVKAAMAIRGLTYADLERDLGLSRTYLSAVVNGRIYSDIAVKKISDYLDIPDGEFTIQIKYIPKKA